MTNTIVRNEEAYSCGGCGREYHSGPYWKNRADTCGKCSSCDADIKHDDINRTCSECDRKRTSENAQATLSKAKELGPNDKLPDQFYADHSLYPMIPYDGLYMEDPSELKEWLELHQEGEDEHTGEKVKKYEMPDELWCYGTLPTEFKLDAYDIVDCALQGDHYEDAVDTIGDNAWKELQEFLDKWCAEQAIVTHWPDHAVKVRV